MPVPTQRTSAFLLSCWKHVLNIGRTCVAWFCQVVSDFAKRVKHVFATRWDSQPTRSQPAQLALPTDKLCLVLSRTFGLVSAKRFYIFQIPCVVYSLKRSHLWSMLRPKKSSLFFFSLARLEDIFRKTFGSHFTDPTESLEDGIHSRQLAWPVRTCVYNALIIVATLLKKGKLKVAYRCFYKKAAPESRYIGFWLIWKETSTQKPAKSGTGKGERTVLPGCTLGQKKSGHVPAALPTGQIRCDL